MKTFFTVLGFILIFLLVCMAVLADGPIPTQSTSYTRNFLRTQNSTQAQIALGFTGTNLTALTTNVIASIAASTTVTQAMTVLGQPTNSFLNSQSRLVWSNFVDPAGVWKFYQGGDGSTLISNTTWGGYFQFFTNGSLTVQGVTNGATVGGDGIIMDASLWAPLGNGILGDDIMHVNGDDAQLELGGTGSQYWANTHGFLPSWIWQKRGEQDPIPYNESLALLAHNNGAQTLPWFDEVWYTNGSTMTYSNVDSGAGFNGNGIWQDTNGTIYVGAGQTPCFVNTIPAYANTGGGKIILTAFQQAMQIVSTTGNNVEINWSHQGGSSFDEALKEPDPVLGGANFCWSLSGAANGGQIGLFQEDSGIAGCDTNFEVLGSVTATNGVGSSASQSVPFNSTGITNTLATNLRIFNLTGNSLVITNFNNGHHSTFSVVNSFVILQPGEAIWGSGLAESTNWAF